MSKRQKFARGRGLQEKAGGGAGTFSPFPLMHRVELCLIRRRCEFLSDYLGAGETDLCPNCRFFPQPLKMQSGVSAECSHLKLLGFRRTSAFGGGRSRNLGGNGWVEQPLDGGG
jgi:hypothetical protein